MYLEPKIDLQPHTDISQNNKDLKENKHEEMKEKTDVKLNVATHKKPNEESQDLPISNEEPDIQTQTQQLKIAESIQLDDTHTSICSDHHIEEDKHVEEDKHFEDVKQIDSEKPKDQSTDEDAQSSLENESVE